MRVLVSQQAVLAGGCPVIVVVYPHVRSILDAFLDWQRLVCRVRLVAGGVFARDRRPKHGVPLDGRHDVAEIVELRAAAEKILATEYLAMYTADRSCFWIKCDLGECA